MDGAAAKLCNPDIQVCAGASLCNSPWKRAFVSKVVTTAGGSVRCAWTWGPRASLRPGHFHTRPSARDGLRVNGDGSADGARSAAPGFKGTPKAPSLMVGHERAHNAGRMRVRDAEVRTPPPVPEVAILRPFRAIWPPRSGWWRFAADPGMGRASRPSGCVRATPRRSRKPRCGWAGYRPGTGPVRRVRWFTLASAG